MKLDKVRFVEQYPGKDSFDEGKVVVNWDNVEAVCEVMRKEEDDE